MLQKMRHSLNIISRAQSMKRWKLDGGIAAVVTSTLSEFSATSYGFLDLQLPMSEYHSGRVGLVGLAQLGRQHMLPLEGL